MVISSQVITDSPVILRRYLPFSQVHVEEFKKKKKFHAHMTISGIVALTSTFIVIPLFTFSTITFTFTLA